MDNATSAQLPATKDHTTPVPAQLDDDPFFHITVELFETSTFYCNVIVIPIICVVGFVGNSLGVGVLWRDSLNQKLSIYFYLFALTFVDSFYLFLGLLRSVPQLISVWDKTLGNYLDTHMQLVSIYLDMTMWYTTQAILLVMSIERLNALVRPFSVKYSCFTKHPRKIIAGCLITYSLWFLAFPLTFKISSFTNADNQTEYYIHFKPEAVATMETVSFIQTVINNYMVTIVIMAVNIAIPIAFSRMVTRRLATLQMPESQRGQQKKITLVVLCITTLYFLCNLPDLFIKTLAFIDKEYGVDGKYSLSFWFFMNITNIFTYLNAANDFVVYVLVSAHYRRVFKAMYCRCCRTTPELRYSLSSGDGASTPVKSAVIASVSNSSGCLIPERQLSAMIISESYSDSVPTGHNRFHRTPGFSSNSCKSPGKRHRQLGTYPGQ